MGILRTRTSVAHAVTSSSVNNAPQTDALRDSLNIYGSALAILTVLTLLPNRRNLFVRHF